MLRTPLCDLVGIEVPDDPGGDEHLHLARARRGGLERRRARQPRCLEPPARPAAARSRRSPGRSPTRPSPSTTWCQRSTRTHFDATLEFGTCGRVVRARRRRSDRYRQRARSRLPGDAADHNRGAGRGGRRARRRHPRRARDGRPVDTAAASRRSRSSRRSSTRWHRSPSSPRAVSPTGGASPPRCCSAPPASTSAPLPRNARVARRRALEEVDPVTRPSEEWVQARLHQRRHAQPGHRRLRHRVRARRTEFTDRWQQRRDELRADPSPVLEEISAAAAEGRMQELLAVGGQSAGLVTELVSAADVVRTLVAEAEDALASGGDCVRGGAR